MQGIYYPIPPKNPYNPLEKNFLPPPYTLVSPEDIPRLPTGRGDFESDYRGVVMISPSHLANCDSRFTSMFWQSGYICV
jgi:hypothetical protein